MFRFRGTTGRRDFAIGMAIRIGLFALATLIFLPLLGWYTVSSNCSGISGACGAVGLIFSLAYKPLVFLILFFALPALLARRLRDIGISPWWSLFLLLLIAADNQVLIFAGAPWSFGFSAGVLRLSPPYFLLLALVLFVGMAALPSRSRRIGIKALGWPAILCIVLAAWIGIAAGLSLLRTIQPLTIIPLLIRLPAVTRLLTLLAPFVMAAFVPAVLLTLWPRTAEIVDTSEPVPCQPIPFQKLALIALCMTFVVLLIALPHELGFAVILFWFGPIGVPTFFLYFGLVLAVYLLVWRRSPGAIVLAVLMLLVLGSWGYQLVDVQQSHDADTAAIAATPLAPLPALHPRAVLVDDGSGSFLYLLLHRADIDWVYEERAKGTYVKYPAARDSKDRSYPKGMPADGLPATYLSLKTWRASSFAADRVRYAKLSPYELRLIDGSSDQLVAVWYEREVQPLLVPPVLAPYGWMRNGNQMSDTVDAARKQFVLNALGPAPLPDPVPTKTSNDCPAGTSGKRHTLFDRLFCPDAKPVVTPAKL